ncbi:IS1182 family transposase [Enterococcus raffinosus]|uniref:IS1182 family transposase n=1 Tax=Enterococcus raffinosus TaxID=71452 RepID=UPI0022E702F6|nr:IS1182 family transposase [Enterococcus raffinosus]
MLKQMVQTKLSPYSDLYDLLIPADHILRRFNELVDFSFVYEELENKYCLNDGRNAYDPIKLFKYLMLKAMFPASDVDLVARSKTDMAYKYFLGLAPEDEVIDPSLLTKFRRQRLNDSNLLDLLLNKTVQLAIEKEIIKSKGIIVDATHTASRFNKKSAVELLRSYSKKVRKAIYTVKPEAKQIMPEKNRKNEYQAEKDYVKTLLKAIEEHPEWSVIPAVAESVNQLKETVEDCQEYEVYSHDTSAKVGHKTAETEFFGYKTHLAITEERIIAAASVTGGDVGDGPYLKELVEKSRANGIDVKEVIGDTAYSGKANLLFTAEEKIKLYSKLHPVISNGTRDPEQEWEYNKDAGMYVCPNGQLAFRKAVQGKKNQGENQRLTFYFDVKKCQACPLNEDCYKEGAKSKTYSVTIQSQAHSDQQTFQETEAFQKRYRMRYMIEGKNSEIKNRHGYNVSWSKDIEGMMLQGASTLFVTNLKRIVKLIDEKAEEK